MTQPLSLEESVYFLRRFREARYKTLADAEDFMSVCFCLEEFGLVLTRKKKTLFEYESDFFIFLQKSYATTSLSVWFEMVRQARNDAAHRGVYARRIAKTAVRLSLAFEEVLMSQTDIKCVAHIMTEGFIEAKGFYTLAKIREMILENSFSYIPYFHNGKYYFISDTELVRIWSDKNATKERKTAIPIKDMIDSFNLIQADEMEESESVAHAILKNTHLPLMVYKKCGSEEEHKEYVGILTPFDLL